MNCYQKFGRAFINSLMRHLAAATGVWGFFEVKYQDFNWHDWLWSMLVAAVIPTVKEMLDKGFPEDDPPEAATVISKETNAGK